MFSPLHLNPRSVTASKESPRLQQKNGKSISLPCSSALSAPRGASTGSPSLRPNVGPLHRRRSRLLRATCSRRRVSRGGGVGCSAPYPRHALAPAGREGTVGEAMGGATYDTAGAPQRRRRRRGGKRKGLGEEWGWGQPRRRQPWPWRDHDAQAYHAQPRLHIRRGRADTDFFATQGRRWTSTDCQRRRLAPPATPAVLLACSRSRSREAAVSSSFSRARRRLLFLLPRAPLPPSSPRAGNPLPPLR
jgi:hypothetical protein